jgi:hypothetical protein
MKNLITILMLIIPAVSFSNGSLSWIQQTRGVSVAADNSNNVFTIDYDYNPAGDIYLTKRNSNGTFLWTVRYDQTENSKWEKAVWAETDNLGNVIVAGTLMSGYSNPVNAASIIMKFDSDGNLLWRNVYENSFDGSYTKKCLVDANNNIYIFGMGSSVQYGYTTKVKKFAPDGSTVWTYFNDGGIGAPVNFKFTADNKIVIAARSVFGSVNGFAKLDLDGNPIWSIGGINSLSVGDIAGDSYGNSYLISAEYVFSNQRTMMKKIDPAGQEIWVRYFTLAAQRIEMGSDNMPVAAGYPTQNSFGSAFVKVDANGDQIWLNPDADGPNNLLLHAQLRMDPQNNIYLAAGTMTEMAICKVNSNGTSGWTLTMQGSYANGFDFGSDNSVFVVGGTTAKINQSATSPATLNLSMFIEGFYNALSNSQVSDTISVQLRNSTLPYALVDETQGILASDGTTQLAFENTSSGNYYLKITHPNSIETWSSSGVTLTSGGFVSYDFTSASSKAFGSNMKQLDATPLKYGIFVGDQNQDGSVNLSDVVSVHNVAISFVNGNTTTDMNGDNITDLSDLVLTANNASAFIVKIVP